MKTLTSIFIVTILMYLSVLAEDTNALRPNVFLFATNDVEFVANTNLVSFFPSVQLMNINEMLKTNGWECLVNILNQPFECDSNAKPPTFWPAPVCFVSVYNHSTSFVGCLRMPATNLCRIALIDKEGHQVKKTAFGMMYGLPLSQKQIEDWRLHSSDRRDLSRFGSVQSIFLKLIPNGIPKFVGVNTEVCRFSIKDAFEIKKAGEYELHLQLRLVQVGKDDSGKIYYPVTWLPEVVTKVQIRPEDIAVENLSSTKQTNSVVK
jgi:hypothetical protein